MNVSVGAVSRATIPGSPRACEFCGAIVRIPNAFPEQRQGCVCDSAECRALAARKSTVNAAAFAHLVRMRARQAREQRERDLAAARQLRKHKDAEAAVNEVLWRSLAGQHGPHPAAEYARVVLPCGPRRLVNLPQWRRNLYRDHLNRTISKAALAPARNESRPAADGEQSAHDPAPAMESRLCAACGGGCCTRGGESAYITVDTIRRYMRNHPLARPREILAAYLDRVANRTELQSCVNHGEYGCTLPRDMRSDVCNSYRCGALNEWRRRSTEAPAPRGALVIVRRQDNWSRDKTIEFNEVIATTLIVSSG